MKYKDLLYELLYMTDEQLNCDVTVELGQEEECFPAEFRICDIEHFCLDENHPVIYVP